MATTIKFLDQGYSTKLLGEGGGTQSQQLRVWTSGGGAATLPDNGRDTLYYVKEMKYFYVD